MVNYTNRLDGAIRRAAWAHEKQNQHRTGTDIPYIIHPFGVMTIAGNYTDNEDVLVACLLHDVLEDVDANIYNEFDMELEFGQKVVLIVKDVTNNRNISDWHERSRDYLAHLENIASDEAVVVSAADKMHNLKSTLIDYGIYGDNLWQRFATKNAADQVWWYQSVFKIVCKRNDTANLRQDFALMLAKLEAAVEKQPSLV